MPLEQSVDTLLYVRSPKKIVHFERLGVLHLLQHPNRPLIIEPYRVEKLKGVVAPQSNGKLPKQSAIVGTGEQKR
jgi:hypothetical protein